jgi:hypothetical protein
MEDHSRPCVHETIESLIAEFSHKKAQKAQMI